MHVHTQTAWDLVRRGGAGQGRGAAGCVPRPGDRDRVRLLHRPVTQRERGKASAGAAPPSLPAAFLPQKYPVARGAPKAAGAVPGAGRTLRELTAGDGGSGSERSSHGRSPRASGAATAGAPEPCAGRGTITESWLKTSFSPIKREERFHIHRNHQVGNPAGKEGPGRHETQARRGREGGTADSRTHAGR